MFLLFLMHCGISTKQKMELLSCDLTSCYICQSFTDLQWSRTWNIKKSKNQKKTENQKIKKIKKSKHVIFVSYSFALFEGKKQSKNVIFVSYSLALFEGKKQSKKSKRLILWLIEMIYISSEKLLTHPPTHGNTP